MRLVNRDENSPAAKLPMYAAYGGEYFPNAIDKCQYLHACYAFVLFFLCCCFGVIVVAKRRQPSRSPQPAARSSFLVRCGLRLARP